MKVSGRVWKFGNDIDTDQIYPGKYLPITNKEEMAFHAMEGGENAENFAEKVRQGDILVAENNFGCGSSREHAAIALRGAGIACIIAKSFARIFYRNCVNIGLPVLRLKEVNEINDGDKLSINLKTGEILNLETNKCYQAKPLSGLELQIMNAGGLLDYLRKEIF